MAFERAFITMTFAVDLDAVPGWGHQVEDWENLVKRELSHNSHYKPEVTIHRTEVKDYVHNERYDANPDREPYWLKPEASPVSL